MSDLPTETADERTATGRSIELMLQQLWERARRVSSIVVKLREENESLRERVRELEDSSRAIFNERERLIVRIAQEEASGRSLKDEMTSVRQRLTQIEESDTNARRALDDVTVQLEQTRRELVRLQANGTGPFSREEKDQLRARVTELIQRINSRL